VCVVGALRLCRGGLDIEKLIKPPMIYSVSYFDLGGLLLCLGVLAHQSPPTLGDGIAIGDHCVAQFCNYLFISGKALQQAKMCLHNLLVIMRKIWSAVFLIVLVHL